MIPNFKGRPYKELTNEQKVALVERVCMEHCEYLASFGRRTINFSFLDIWKDKILTYAPSNSAVLDRYIYSETMGFCLMDRNANLIQIQNATEEIVVFVYNVINDVPVLTPLLQRVLAGELAEKILDEGIPAAEYGVLEAKQLKRKGRPVNPQSKAQRIKRGETTRYREYQMPKKEA